MPVDRRTAGLADLLRATALAAFLAAPAGAVLAQADDRSDERTASQDAEEAEEVVADDLAAEEEPLYTQDDLKDLAAPVALYPDALLAQILIAATAPLDVVMADRWLDENADMEPADVEDAVADETWDPSVKALMVFPTVIGAMADDPDWTQDLGDAFVVQQSDLLDAVQDLRAEAQAAGNLESNEAQNVVVDEDDAIVIEPAQPDVVYVPTYDPNVVYQPAPAAATTVPATTTVVQDDDSDVVGTAIVSGLVGFGAGLLVAEVFDDDDDWCCGYRGIGWGHGNVYVPPYRGGRYQRGDNIVVNGDVNINRRPWKPDDRDRVKRERKLEQKRRDTGDVRRSKPRTASYAREAEERRARQGHRGAGDARRSASRPTDRKVGGQGNARDVQRQLQARGKTDGGRKISKPSAAATPQRKTSGKSAFSQTGGGSRSKSIKDRSRGKASLQKSRGSAPKAAASAAGRKPVKASTQRKAAPQRKAVAKPRATPAKRKVSAPTRKAPKKSSAFSGARKKSAGRSAGRAKSRGAASRGGGRRR